MHYAARKEAGYNQYFMRHTFVHGFEDGNGYNRRRYLKKLAKTETFEEGQFLASMDSPDDNGAFEVLATFNAYVRVVYVPAKEKEWSYTPYWHHASWFTLKASDRRQWDFERQLDDIRKQHEFELKQVKETKSREAFDLSKNTVTRALIHAADNGYCHETAVALISAGHKMPDLTVDIEFTVRASIHCEGNKSYYLLRQLFGAKRGDVQGASGVITNSEYARQAIHQYLKKANRYELIISDMKHLDTGITFHEPTQRVMDEDEASKVFAGVEL